MLSCNDFMNAYQNIYAAMRYYIWGVDVIEILANLEVAVYNAFLNIDEVDRWFTKLEKAIKTLRVTEDDEELAQFLENFRKLIDECDDQYHPLYQVNEVIDEEELHGN